jgi:hypothetical protein
MLQASCLCRSSCSWRQRLATTGNAKIAIVPYITIPESILLRADEVIR